MFFRRCNTRAKETRLRDSFSIGVSSGAGNSGAEGCRRAGNALLRYFCNCDMTKRTSCCDKPAWGGPEGRKEPAVAHKCAGGYQSYPERGPNVNGRCCSYGRRKITTPVAVVIMASRAFVAAFLFAVDGMN